MIKKIFFASFVSLLFFFFVTPTLPQQTANAVNPCALGKLLNFSIKPKSPVPSNSIVVTFVTPVVPETYDIEWGEIEKDGPIFHGDYSKQVNSPEDGKYTIVHSKWKFGLVRGHTYYIEVSVYKFGEGTWCGKTEFAVEKFEPTGSPVIKFGGLSEDRKTLSDILITNLEGATTYRIELEGLWEWDWMEDYRDRNTPGEIRRIFKSDEKGKLKLTTICENGQAFREDSPCGEMFKPGDYTVIIILRENGKDVGRKTWTVAAPSEDGLEEDPLAYILGDPDNPTRKSVITLLNFAIGMAGGVAFLLMIFGSYRLIFAGGNPESIQQGREVITSAIIGLIIIVFSVFILRFLGITILGMP